MAGWNQAKVFLAILFVLNAEFYVIYTYDNQGIINEESRHPNAQ